MNIVEPAPDDVTLDEAARIAGCSAKTLRRAVQDGHLPRRYVLSPRGPRLVCGPADLARWLAARQATRLARHAVPAREGGTQRGWPEVAAQVAQLQASLDESRGMVAGLVRGLRERDDAMAAARETVTQVAGKVAGLEAGGAGARAAEPAPAAPATRPPDAATA